MPITLDTVTNIDVTTKQEELVRVALSENSVYMTMKDNVKELLDNTELSQNDRAKIVSETVGSMAVSITASTMQTALQWAAREKELELKKSELEYRLDLLANQIEESKQSQETSLASRNLAIARTIRDYGTYTVNTEGEIVSLNNNGRLYQEEQNVIKQGSILDEQVLMEGYKEEVMLATKQDKIDLSSYDKRKKLSETLVTEGTQTTKINQATAQLNKTDQETSYINTQEEQLIASVTYNNKIKALSALGQTYGTFGAGGLTVSSDMWSTYFNIVSDLSTVSIPVSTTVSKVT